MIIQSNIVSRSRNKTCRLLSILDRFQQHSHPGNSRNFNAGAPIQTPTPINTNLRSFTNDLDLICPSFRIDSSQIEILSTPTEFYSNLKAKILGAEKRIFLTTLYIGASEKELISLLQNVLRRKPDLKVSILTDALRGTRESPAISCASLIAPLALEFGHLRVELRMYHTPNLVGIKKRYLPKRINEGWGLQHMKLYGFDNEIIISGANLSHDYFTNRQDRYHIFYSEEIANHFYRLHMIISSLSYLVKPDSELAAGYSLEWPVSNTVPSPLSSPTEFVNRASNLLLPIIRPSEVLRAPKHESDTIVYPLSQLTSLFPSCADASTELSAISSLLSKLSTPQFKTSSWTFTAGYFNPIPKLTSLLLATASTNNNIITASPWANGFYGSKGISGLLPPAYTLLLSRFLKEIIRKRRKDDISLKEWRRGTAGQPDGWTYHAKGLWISLSPKTEQGRLDVNISVIGSSNFTQRSYCLDLEAGVVIVTSNKDLMARLGKERDNLSEHAGEIGSEEFKKVERKVKLKVRLAMWIVKLAGGAL
ncbi:BgTH12-02364 [Blumeria graminis f. sp. triticale]|uniref:CDP-diacylglycerol--glycerol-3-phosphate 3-phosphatidyltransferase n=3 Tax=Blumeria graminis TaxID=34373 RepID=A0A9X9MGG9_BLUGR|nr:hypothetical protein BGT96224_A20856 [Blumeria graminis f. sp. tritici 96224]CAD6502123.1 BgTH12-02364 [Blumeria graminis f. sp. triticale]VDB86141.1 BgtA-20856 [Blumeria graminis f. sp. tritici]